jgi:hypothetical protein
MRVFAMVVSILLILLGALWTLQGAGLVGGSFMTGSSRWLYIGIASVLLGVVWLLLIGRAGGRGPR